MGKQQRRRRRRPRKKFNRIDPKKWQVGAPLENVFTKETGGGVAVLIRAGMCNMSMMHDRITKEDMWEMNLVKRTTHLKYGVVV